MCGSGAQERIFCAGVRKHVGTVFYTVDEANGGAVHRVQGLADGFAKIRTGFAQSCLISFDKCAKKW